MTAMKHIPVSHVFFTDESKLKDLLFNETLLHICSIDEDESKGINVNKVSTEEDES